MLSSLIVTLGLLTSSSISTFATDGKEFTFSGNGSTIRTSGSSNISNQSNTLTNNDIAPIFKPAVKQIRNQLPRGLTVRLPSYVPNIITQAGKTRLDVKIEQDNTWIAIKYVGCENDFPGGRGYALNCIPLRMSSGTLDSKFYKESQFQRRKSINIAKNIKAFHFQGDSFNVISWVQSGNYFQIYSGTISLNELTKLARSMIDGSVIESANSKGNASRIRGSDNPSNQNNAQAAKTRKILIKDLGYSFDVPNWARVIRNGKTLEVLTQTSYEQRMRGDKKCMYQDSNIAGCSEFDITIEENGRKQLAQAHKELLNPCGRLSCGLSLISYTDKIVVNGRVYRKYELQDEHSKWDIYFLLTNKNHLVTFSLNKEPYAGSKDALTTVMASFSI